MNDRGFLPGRLGCLLACILPVAGAAAQETKPELREPILARMPAQSAWKLEYFEGVASSSDGSPPTPAEGARPHFSVIIRKDGQTYHVRYDRDIGGYRDFWIIDGVTIALTGGRGSAAIVSPVWFPATDFSKSDFEDFQWVTAQNFAGVVEREETAFLKFQAPSTGRAFSPREQFQINAMVRERQLAREDPENTSDTPAPERSPEGLLRQTMGWGDQIAAFLTVGQQRPVILWTGQSLVRVTIAAGGQRLNPPAAVRTRLDIEKEKLDRLGIKTNRRPG